MLFYLQDSRGYVGNDVLWWAKEGKGYTTDLSKAQVYTKEDAQSMHESRHSDIPWPVEYIQGKTRPAVDMQYINQNEALEGTGIELIKQVKQKEPRMRCCGCGAFLSEASLWAGKCKKCNCDNRP